ncbi:hypothetical protein GCM10027612_68870 [Microbispora bryophytorum subsp. camponoti]
MNEPERHDQDPAFRNPALSPAERVDDLLGRLTLDEKIGLLHQYQAPVERLGLRVFRTGTEALHGLAWHGPATVFPQAIGLASTWNPDLVRQVGRRPATRSWPSTTRTRRAWAATSGRRWSTRCATRAGAATRRATPRTPG